MFNSLKNKARVQGVPISTKVTLLLPVETVSNGVLVRSSSFQTIDASVSENQFAASDFSIGNLRAIGALNLLNSSCVVNTSRLTAADSFDNFNLTSDVPQES